MTIDLIIFDCDGVLVDSEPLANEQLRLALAEWGLVLSLEEVVGHFVGLSMTSVIHKAEKMLGAKTPEDFLHRLQIKTFAAFRRGLKAVQGIEAVLERLQVQGQSICVASSGDFTKMELTLGLTGLQRFFVDHIYSASQVRRGKPYPDLYLYAADQMGVEPARCLVIEDSLPGVQGAVAAGMEVLAYSARGEDQALAKAGGMVIKDMRQVIEFINE